jgi:hypothetical protein
VSVEKSGESFQDKEEKENEASTSKMEIIRIKFYRIANYKLFISISGD